MRRPKRARSCVDIDGPRCERSSNDMNRSARVRDLGGKARPRFTRSNKSIGASSLVCAGAGKGAPVRASDRRESEEPRRRRSKVNAEGSNRPKDRASSEGPKWAQSATGSKDTNPERFRPSASRKGPRRLWLRSGGVGPG